MMTLFTNSSLSESATNILNPTPERLTHWCLGKQPVILIIWFFKYIVKLDHKRNH